MQKYVERKLNGGRKIRQLKKTRINTDTNIIILLYIDPLIHKYVHIGENDVNVEVRQKLLHRSALGERVEMTTNHFAL